MKAEIYFEKLSSLVLEFIVEYHKRYLISIIDKNDFEKEPKKFFYTIMHKTICSLEAGNIFIRNFDSKRSFHTPLFVILRSIISDIIIAEYLIRIPKTDDEGNLLIKQIYFDHYDNLIKNCEKTLCNLYRWSEKEKQEIINDLKKNEEFFLPDGTPKVEPFKTSPSHIIRKIVSSRSDEKSLIIIKKAYNLYDTFSKFEHLGSFSFKLTHRGYDDKEQEQLRFDLYDSIIVTIAALINYTKIWDDFSNEDYDFFKDLELKINKMHPGQITAPNNG